MSAATHYQRQLAKNAVVLATSADNRANRRASSPEAGAHRFRIAVRNPTDFSSRNSIMFNSNQILSDPRPDDHLTYGGALAKLLNVLVGLRVSTRAAKGRAGNRRRKLFRRLI
jgi:hypothetical protein